MSSKKRLSQEEKVVEFIVSNVEQNHFDYSNVRQKINFKIGENKPVKNNSLFNNTLKFALSFSIAIMSIITMFFAINNEYGILKNNKVLSTIVANDTNENYTTPTEPLNSIYALMFNYDQILLYNRRIYEVTFSKDNDSNYYCAYLPNKIIEEIEQYAKWETSKINFEKMAIFSALQGIDNLLLKYKSYCERKNIDVINSAYALKWVIAKDVESIINQIGEYQLILIMNVQDNNGLKQLTNYNNPNPIFKYISESKFKVVDNQIQLLNKEYDIYAFDKYIYVSNLLKTNQNTLYVYEKQFFWNSIRVHDFNGIDYLEQIIPHEYFVHMADEHSDGSDCIHGGFEGYYQISNLLSPYKLLEFPALDIIGKQGIKIIYDYDRVKQLFETGFSID